MTGSLREATDAVLERPSLVGYGAVVAAVEAMVILALYRPLSVTSLSAPVDRISGVSTLEPLILSLPGFVLLQAVVFTVALLPLIPLYIACRNTLYGDGVTGDEVRTDTDLLQTVVRRYGELLGPTVLFLIAGVVFAVPVALALNSGFIVLDTSVRVAAYALSAGVDPQPILTVAVLLALTGLSFVLGRFPFAFYDVLLLFADDRATGAWNTSFRFSLTRPRSVIRYSAVVTALLLPPAAIGVLITRAGPETVWTVAGVLTYVLLGGINRTVAAAYHVSFFEDRVAPAVCRDTGPNERAKVVGVDRPLVQRPARVLLVVLLIAGLVVGAAGLRTADARPDDEVETKPVDASTDPETALSNANEYTDTVNHRVTRREYWYRDSPNDTGLAWVYKVSRAPQDREWRINITSTSVAGTASSTYMYASDGTIATDNSEWDEGMIEDADPFRRVDNGWIINAEPAYTNRQSLRDIDYVPGSKRTDWRVVDETDDVIVYGAKNASGIAAAAPSPHPGSGGMSFVSDSRNTTAEFYPDSFANVTVAKETGYVKRIAVRQNLTVRDDDGTRTHYHVYDEVEFTDYGNDTVARPDTAGSPSAFEYLWDLASY